jgi:membrane fusion protein
LRSQNDIYDKAIIVAEKGFISKFQMEQRKQQVLESSQSLSKLELDRENILGELSRLQASLFSNKANYDQKRNNVGAAKSGVTLQKIRYSSEESYTLRASSNGIVTAIQTAVGKTVGPNAAILSVVPKSSIVHAELYAPSRAIGLLGPGQEVRLQYDAFPFQRYGTYKGVVVSVSRVSIDPREVVIPIQADEPMYKIQVQIPDQSISAFGKHHKIQSGMMVSGVIILERQSFIEWLIEPILAVGKRGI